MGAKACLRFPIVRRGAQSQYPKKFANLHICGRLRIFCRNLRTFCARLRIFCANLRTIFSPIITMLTPWRWLGRYVQYPLNPSRFKQYPPPPSLRSGDRRILLKPLWIQRVLDITSSPPSRYWYITCTLSQFDEIFICLVKLWQSASNGFYSLTSESKTHYLHFVTVWRDFFYVTLNLHVKLLYNLLLVVFHVIFNNDECSYPGTSNTANDLSKHNQYEIISLLLPEMIKNRSNLHERGVHSFFVTL